MLFESIYRFRVTVYALCTALVLGTGLGIGQLQVSTDNRIFYGPENPYYNDYLEFQARFTDNDNILFVIAGPYQINQGQFGQAIRWLSENVSRLDFVLRVDSLANYPKPVTENEVLSVQPILDWICPEGQPCRSDVAAALLKPQLINRMVNDKLTTTGLLATVSIDHGAVGDIEALHQAATDLANQFEREYPEFKVYFTGGVPMMAAFAAATASDLGLLLPAALLLISVLLALVLGSTKLAMAIVAVGLASITTTLGIAGWAGHVLNNATSIVPLVVFTLVVASSMHIAVHFTRNLPTGASEAVAIDQSKASFTSSITPILLSAATSAASLCSLWFVDSPPIRQLGLISAMGVVAGCGFTVVLLPLLLTKIRRSSETRLSLTIQQFVNAYARRLESGQGSVWGGVVALLICAGGLTQIAVNENFVEFFDESVPFRVQTDMATKLLAGPNHIEVVVSNPSNTVFEPAFLRHLAELSLYLREKPVVANVHSLSDVMTEVSEAFSGQPVSEFSTTDELAQLFLVYELSLLQGQSNTDLIDSAQSSARVSVLLAESTSAQVQDLESEIYDWHRSTGTDFEVVVTGENIPVAHLSWMNIQAMSIGIILSLAFTAIVIGGAFRSARLGVVALLATVVPVIAGFGLWGWIEGDIGLAATAVIALTIGIVVDDAAHFIYRFLDATNRLDLEAWPAAAYACHRAGAAIAGTSVVMGFGLSLLMLSSFEVNSSFGAVACLIIISALGFNLTILPALTVWAAKSFEIGRS
ncbi:MAG: MMPL family transporter [Pseudomonadales bacterium]